MLKGNKIVLRAMEPADASLLFKWENNSELWHISETLAPYSLHQLNYFIEQSISQDIYSSRELRLMISNNDDIVLGIVDLFQFDPKNKRVGIGVLVHKDYRKQGIASESIALIKDYCFTHLQLQQIWCTISTQNIESISLFNKAGFEKSGLLKQWNINSCSNFEDVLILQCIKKTS